jgi:MFS family permease
MMQQKNPTILIDIIIHSSENSRIMAGHSEPTKRIVLLTSALGSSLAPFMVSALVVALPTIGKEFSTDAVLLGWLTSSFFLGAAVFLVPIGGLADIHGVKRVFSIGIAIYGISALLCLLSPSATFLIAARFLTGIGAAMIFGTSIALLSLVFPPEERGKAIGINVMAMTLGFLLGFLAGGFLIFYVGWRGIFLFVIPVTLIVTALIRFRIPGECALARTRKPDRGGSILFGLMIFFFMIGCTLLPRVSGIVAIVFGTVFTALFIRWERNCNSPLLDLHLFSGNTVFLRANVVVLLAWAGSFAVSVLGSLYLQDVRGFDSRGAGVILLSQVIATIIFVPYGGRLSDRINPAIVASGGLIVLIAGLVPLIFISQVTPLPVVIAAYFLFGLGIAFFQPSLAHMLINAVGEDNFGLAGSMAESMRLAGITLSLAIMTIIFSLVLGGAAIVPAHISAFLSANRTIMLVFTAISVSGLIICLTLRHQKSTEVRNYQ